MDLGRKRARAEEFKAKGNEACRKAAFQTAVEHYTAAIEADPGDAILPCNRAFARLKLQQWALAERDCSRSLALLPAPNCKALFRRATARRQLEKWDAALVDLSAALALEPDNASVSAELALVKSHLRSNPTVVERPSSSSSSSSSIASARSDSGPPAHAAAGRSASRPPLQHDHDCPGPSTILRELTTTRRGSFAASKAGATVAGPPTESFGALKQSPQEKADPRPARLGRPRPPVSPPSSSTTLITAASPPSSAPIRSFAEFEIRWGISSRPEDRWALLQSVDEHRLVGLFGEHLEPERLDQIVDALQVSLQSNEPTKIAKAVGLLQALDDVSRMKTLTMFLGPDRQKVVGELLMKFNSVEGKNVELKNWGV